MRAIRKPDQGWDLERLYRDHGEQLCRYLCKMTGRHDVAQDIAQASFEKMQEKYGGKPVSHPRALLFATAINFARMRGRHDSMERRVLGERVEIDDADAQGAPMIEVGPEEEALRDQLRTYLLAAINRLSPSLRETMLIDYREGVGGTKRRDMAERLGVSEKRIDKRITEGHRRCREWLIANGIDTTVLSWH